MKSPHYDFAALSEGVTFARARPRGGALSNSALVDLQGEILVFDTSLTPLAAEDLRAASRERLGRPPTLAVNSHWHLDHFLGNQIFADVPTYATRRTLEMLREKREDLMGKVREETLRKDLQEIEGWVTAARRPEVRDHLLDVLEMNRWILREAASIHFSPPNRTFEERLRLPGSSKAELLSFGSGHTESDACVLLPREGILLAGDLIVAGTHPNLTSGNPRHWLEVLDRLEDLRFERVVPGHGPVSSAEILNTMRDYLTALQALASTKGKVEVPPRFAGWSVPDQFDSNLDYVRAGKFPG